MHRVHWHLAHWQRQLLALGRLEHYCLCAIGWNLAHWHLQLLGHRHLLLIIWYLLVLGHLVHLRLYSAEINADDSVFSSRLDLL